MTLEGNDSPLARLQKRLYAPQKVDGLTVKSLQGAAPVAPEHWNREPLPPSRPKVSATVRFLGASISFFILAAVTTGVMLFLGGRSVSPDKVSIELEDALAAVSSGEPATLHILIRNENPVAITGATLRLTFPEGTGEPEDPGTPLPYYEETLGDIPAGGTVRRSIAASFFGTEDQVLSIPLSVEYKTGSSNATFVKERRHELVITNAPVLLSIRTLSEITPGQELSLVLSVRSNAAIALADVAVRAEGRPYPFGFSETEASPESDGGLFRLGTLLPGEEREVRIAGTVIGQAGEERVFRFTVGSLRSETARDFAVLYTEEEAAVLLAEPFFSVSLSLNRDTEEIVVVSAGEPIAGLLSWKNALPSVIENGEITLSLQGDVLDAARVDAGNGFYQSADRTIRYDRDTTPGLAELAEGDTGNGTFTLYTKTGSALSALRNPSIALNVSIFGRRVGAGAVAETITATLSRTIKVRTNLSLSTRAVRDSGTIENTGPWPPVAEQETTYTIELSAANTVNSAGGTKAVLSLPSYVRYTGVTTPGSALTYNETTREVTWSIGDFPPGENRTAAFQVAFLPSISQQGTRPVLVSPATMRGVDRFVQEEVSGTAPSVSVDAAVK